MARASNPLLARLAQLELERDGIEQFDLQSTLDSIFGDLHPKQLDFVQDQSTGILGVSAGYGAGKTRALCAKAISLAAANQGFIGIVMEPTGPLIRDIWLNDFDDFLETYNIPHSFRASPLPEYSIHLPEGDSKILCRSFEAWQRCIGTNAAWILADEIDTVPVAISKKAFPKILGRLRAGNVRQFASASTPEGWRWMYQTFASDEVKDKTDRRLIRMKTTDNPHLPEDFIDRMRENYDPNMLQAYLNGEFINLTTGTVYDRFDRSKHVISTVPEKLDIDREPLRVGIDFNVGNMSAVVAIRYENKLIVIDEISGAHDTDALGQELRRRYPQHKIYGYPDASGGNRSTNASKTDIQILESYNISNQSPKANPPVRDRVAAGQALLENGKGEIRVKILSKCVKLIESLELQCWTDKGEPDKDSNFDHMNDAFTYIVWREFNPLQAGVGRGTGVRVY